MTNSTRESGGDKEMGSAIWRKQRGLEIIQAKLGRIETINHDCSNLKPNCLVKS